MENYRNDYTSTFELNIEDFEERIQRFCFIMNTIGINSYYVHTSCFDSNEYYVVHSFKFFCAKAPLKKLIDLGLPVHLAAKLSSFCYEFKFNQIDDPEEKKFERCSEVFTEISKIYTTRKYSSRPRDVIRDLRFKNTVPYKATNDQFIQAVWNDAFRKMMR